MALRTKRVTDIARIGGTIYVRFGKVELEFSSRRQVIDWARDTVDITNDEGLYKLLVRRWLRLDANGSNPAVIVGRSATIDDATDTVVYG